MGPDDVVNTVVTTTRWLANHPDAVVFPIADRPVIGAIERAGIQMSDDPSGIGMDIDGPGRRRGRRGNSARAAVLAEGGDSFFTLLYVNWDR